MDFGVCGERVRFGVFEKEYTSWILVCVCVCVCGERERVGGGG